MEVISVCSLTQGRNPILKKKSWTKLIEIKETLDLRDIWRIRNPKSKCFTFHQNHVSGHFQETVIRIDVLASFCSDHSPIIFTISFESNNRRKVPWKFNKSLLPNDECINKLRNHISESLSILDQNSILDHFF